jgi:hypothetical protein
MTELCLTFDSSSYSDRTNTRSIRERERQVDDLTEMGHVGRVKNIAPHTHQGQSHRLRFSPYSRQVILAKECERPPVCCLKYRFLDQTRDRLGWYLLVDIHIFRGA